MGNVQDKLTSEQQKIWGKYKEEQRVLIERNTQLENECKENQQKIMEATQNNDDLLQAIETEKKYHIEAIDNMKENMRISLKACKDLVAELQHLPDLAKKNEKILNQKWISACYTKE